MDFGEKMLAEQAYLGPNPARIDGYVLKNQDFYGALRILSIIGKDIGKGKSDYTFEITPPDTLFTLVPRLILRLIGWRSTIRPDPEAHVTVYTDDDRRLCISYWATEEGLKRIQKELPPKD
jgi:hypothetical protein